MNGKDDYTIPILAGIGVVAFGMFAMVDGLLVPIRQTSGVIVSVDYDPPHDILQWSGKIIVPETTAEHWTVRVVTPKGNGEISRTHQPETWMLRGDAVLVDYHAHRFSGQFDVLAIHPAGQKAAQK
jgi:hypothetical protein